MKEIMNELKQITMEDVQGAMVLVLAAVVVYGFCVIFN